MQADSGAIGGTASEEFMVLADTGEDAVVRCAACGYGANLEKAETGPRPAPWKDETETPLVEVETPGKGGIDDVVEFLGITASRMIKCLVYETEKGFVVALLRGDLDVNEVALKNMLHVDHLALASEEKVEKATGAPVGYVGPHKLPAEAVRDRRRPLDPRRRQRGHGGGTPRLARRAVSSSGATRRSRPGAASRRRAPETPARAAASPSTSPAASRSATSSSSARSTRRRSAACSRTRRGSPTPRSWARTASASAARWRRRSSSTTTPTGSCGRWRVAPFEIVLVSLNPSDEATRREADALYDALVAAGLDVFYDDRDERPGVKFKDADLVGFPIRVNVGGRALKEGKVEIVRRRDKNVRPVETAGARGGASRLCGRSSRAADRCGR